MLICFSLADQDTLTNVVENWSPEIRHFCGNAPVILVGNKKDLRDAESSLSSSKGSLNVNAVDDNIARQKVDDTHSSRTDILESNLPMNSSPRDANKDLDHTVVLDRDSSNRIHERPISSLYSLKSTFHASAPVKHSEGVQIAKRIGAMAYFETSALTGDNVEELLLATTKAAVLGTKKSKKFKPFTNTMTSWKSQGALALK